MLRQKKGPIAQKLKDALCSKKKKKKKKKKKISFPKYLLAILFTCMFEQFQYFILFSLVKQFLDL